MRRPSIASGRSMPSRCRMVGATSVMLTKPSLLVVVDTSQPGLDPRRAHRRDGERRARRAAGPGRPRAPRRARSRPRRGARRPGDRCRAARGRTIFSPCSSDANLVAERRAHEVGALDEHDRAVGVHASVNASSTASWSSRTPNGAVGSGCSNSRSTCPPGTSPVGGHQRRHRGASGTAARAAPACSGRCRRRSRSRPVPRPRSPARRRGGRSRRRTARSSLSSITSAIGM